MKINYVIATYNGFTKRYFNYPHPEDVLKHHLENINKYKNKLSQITIMKPKSDNYYKTYYQIEEHFDIPLKIIECDNYGYSMGQWLYCYEVYKNEFDFYLFIEDDYCPNMHNFDSILINIYNKKKIDDLGLLCSLVQGSKDYNRQNNLYPIHFEGCILINNCSLNKLYFNSLFKNGPRKYLNLVDNNTDNKYNWNKIKKKYLGGYYQLVFSYLFTLINIEHYDYVDEFYNDIKLCFPYWNDNISNKKGGDIWFYNKNDIIKKNYIIDDIFNSPFIPIQMSNIGYIQYYTDIKFPIETYPTRMTLDIVDYFSEFINNKIICDIGCGSGDMINYIRLKKLCNEVKGIEINKNRYNSEKKFIEFGDVFKNGLPEADVYIIWIGINFPYQKLLNIMKNDKIILLLDSAEINHEIFVSYKNIELIKKITFSFDEKKYINPEKINKYINEIKQYTTINPKSFILKGKRFFCAYKYIK